MNDSLVTPPISFQGLIKKAEEMEGGEADRSMDLRIEIRTHGKPAHLWKIALRLCRHIHVIFGDSVTFMTTGNDELVDTMEDDDGEYWHSLDWREGKPVEHPVPEADPKTTMTEVQRRHEELVAQRGQH